MSFEIEFNGSLNDRRDLPQVSTSSSLVKSTFNQISPVSWQWGSGSYGVSYSNSTSNINQIGLPIIQPAYFDGSQFSTITSASDVGPYAQFNSTSNYGFFAYAHGALFRLNVSGYSSVNLDFSSFSVGNGDGYFLTANVFFANGNLYGQHSLVGGTSGNINYSGSFTTWGQPYLEIAFFVNSNFDTTTYRIGNVNVYVGGSTGVSVTPQTITNGSQSTGSTGVTPLVSEINQGLPELILPPKEIKLDVKNGVNSVASASVIPDRSTSDYFASVAKTRVFEATDATLTANVQDLDDNNFIDRKSKVIIKDVTLFEER